MLAARRVLAAAAGPKLLVYRVAAGPVPDGHWYHDRRHGGRLLGEVCHFVDTAQALIGAQIEEAAGLPGGGQPGDDAAVSLRFTDGSLATIAYASVPARAGKEWIEVTTGRARIVIDDFRRATADGKVIWKGAPGQGAPGLRGGVPPGGDRRGGDAHRGDAGHHGGHDYRSSGTGPWR